MPLDAAAPRKEDVDQQPVELVDREAVVVGGDDRLRLTRLDPVVREHMAGEHVIERPYNPANRQPATRRKFAGEVGLQRVHVDLVEGDPLAASTGEALGRVVDPRGEAVGRIRGEPKVGPQPRRMGEVMKGHQGHEVAVVRGVEDSAVAVERGFVDPTRLPLAAWPLN